MKGLQRIFDFLGKLLAIVCLAAIILWATDANWHYLPAMIAKIVAGIKEYGGLLLVAVVGFEAASKKIWLLIPFLVILAACIIFMFFDGARDAIFNMIG